jgi:Tfp pilus assembly protein PilN
MNRRPPLDVNLATKPVRNRRFYVLARNILAAAVVIVIGVAAFSVVRYGFQASRLKSSVEETGGLVDAAGKEVRRLTLDIQKAKKTSQSEVDLVNDIIIRKSFSWTEFLSLLEASLPDSSYITSLVPSFSGERTVGLKIKLVSASLDDLLTFLNNLNARKFRFRLESESREEGGGLISEISLTYERNL